MTTETSQVRIEHNSLGDKAVPAQALWGVQTQRAVENFPISGMHAHPAMIRATVLVKKAAALANMETGRLDERIGHAIIQAADEVLDGQWHDHFVVDVYQAGAGTSHNMNANEVLANRAIEMLGGQRGEYKPVHPNDHVNMAQSTNDTFPTAMRLATLLMIRETLPALEALSAAFRGARADEFDRHREVGPDAPAGRDAHTARAGVRGYGITLRRDAERLRHARRDALRAGHWRHGGWHRPQRRAGLHRRHGAQSGRADRLSAPSAASHWWRSRRTWASFVEVLGRAARAGDGPDQDRQRHPSAGVGSARPGSTRSCCRRCSRGRRSCRAR